MDKPLVNLDALSQPMTKLIEVLANGFGTLYAPFGTVRSAHAEAKAMIIRAEAEADVVSIRERAETRIAHRESVRQENLESISNKAAQELPEQVSDEPVDQDWLLQFLNRAQDVNDQDMQTIWGRILAGEVASPGTYSKRTLQFLETLDKSEAEAFTKLCSYTVQDNQGWNMLFEIQFIKDAAGKDMGSAGFIEHFISIGLLSSEAYYLAPSKISGMKCSYFGKQFEFIGPPPPNHKEHAITPIEIPFSFRMLTQIGQQLSQIAGAEERSNFIEGTSDAFAKEFNLTIKPITI